MNITIEDFIKHLESKGYILIDKYGRGDDIIINKCILEKENRMIFFDSSDNTLSIAVTSNLFNGFIESLEQFDLIDRLTS